MFYTRRFDAFDVRFWPLADMAHAD